MSHGKISERLSHISTRLAGEMNPLGYWNGELSSSALAVAVALTALCFDNPEKHAAEIRSGLNWLAANINKDGSFGDTPESPGNVSTSLLVYAAMNIQKEGHDWLTIYMIKTLRYLESKGIDVNSEDFARTILRYYKNDLTFSVPILTMCALCGIPRENSFKLIPQLPFELLLMPGRFYRLLNLNVVSYALPALAAVGIVIFRNKKSGFLLRLIRHFSISRALKKLQHILPESGGYLEAIPLTAFVSLSLIAAGYRNTEIVTKGIGFLKRMQRKDGSWPIDVDLSTWVTSLSVRAFGSNLNSFLLPDIRDKISGHFKNIQNKRVHSFNGTPAGGWGWTNFPGSVPDGDDTPGAILALLKLEPKEKVQNEVLSGGRWLLQLQNNDGGFPTFSRGWGKLPFDQSCADLTGHCLLALSSIIENYRDELTMPEVARYEISFVKALKYLEKNQNNDGSLLPLWFGNQVATDQANPLYGTARVLIYLQDCIGQSWLKDDMINRINMIIRLGTAYIASIQNEDGSWGGAKSVPGSIEETSLAVSALAQSGYVDQGLHGLEWIEREQSVKGFAPAPVGLYFASLWYSEKLYPVIFYLEALTRMHSLPR